MKSTPPFTSEQTVLGHGVYLTVVALALFLAPGLLRVFLPIMLIQPPIAPSSGFPSVIITVHGN
jgi:hypothetical protein